MYRKLKRESSCGILLSLRPVFVPEIHKNNDYDLTIPIVCYIFDNYVAELYETFAVI